MSALKLYIGNYNYSSWSMRAWLVLAKSELPFTTEMIDLDIPGYKDKLLALTDAATVPVLDINGENLPDSLAISEFAAKCVPNLWPTDDAQKSLARQACEKMQNEFIALREEAPMNLRRRTSRPMPKRCLDDAAKMDSFWCDLLSRHDGPFLFGNWSIADAFYTPAATRFASYDLPRSARADTYISELMSDPDYHDWEAMAFTETHILPETDAVNL